MFKAWLLLAFLSVCIYELNSLPVHPRPQAQPLHNPSQMPHFPLQRPPPPRTTTHPPGRPFPTVANQNPGHKLNRRAAEKDHQFRNPKQARVLGFNPANFPFYKAPMAPPPVPAPQRYRAVPMQPNPISAQHQTINNHYHHHQSKRSEHGDGPGPVFPPNEFYRPFPQEKPAARKMVIVDHKDPNSYRQMVKNRDVPITPPPPMFGRKRILEVSDTIRTISPDSPPNNPDFRPNNPDFRPNNPDFRPNNPDFRPNNPDFRPNNPDFRQPDTIRPINHHRDLLNAQVLTGYGF